MKTPESRPRFQTATRHYHRHRSDNRGWDDWIDAKKPGARGRTIRITAAVMLAMAAVALLFAFKVL